MDWATSDVVDVIWILLPGFLAAWVFYGLTTHPRRDSFERIIQAIIFTGIVQVLNTAVRVLLLWASTRVSFGAWTTEVAWAWSVVNAILVGLVFSVFANYDWLHWILRKLQLTKRTSYPSEWFASFNSDKRYVVLHLQGDRRLYGWPFQFPDSSDSGHFVIQEPYWITDANEMIPIHTTFEMLIPASSVVMVERMSKKGEQTISPEQRAAIDAKMIALNTEDEDDGKQSTGPAAVTETGGTTRTNGTATHSPSANSAPAPATQKVNRKKRK